MKLNFKFVCKTIVTTAALAALAIPAFAQTYTVTGGTILARGMNDWIDYPIVNNNYAINNGDFNNNMAEMVLDTGSVPTQPIAKIMIQNTKVAGSALIVGNVNVWVSSHEGEAGFNPQTGVFDVKLADNVVTVGGFTWSADSWRSIELSTPATKRYFLIEVLSTRNEETFTPIDTLTNTAAQFGDVKYYFAGNTATIPHGNVVVDGDISEWGDATWIPMDKIYYLNPSDIPVVNGVRQAFWACKWNNEKNRIYIAARVRDTDRVFMDNYGPSNLYWDKHDDIEVYIHTTSTMSPHYGATHEAAQQFAIGIATNESDSWYAWGDGGAVGAHIGLKSDAWVDGEWLCYEAELVPYNYCDKQFGIDSIVDDLAPGMGVGLDIVNSSCIHDANNVGTFSGMISDNMYSGLYDRWDLFTVRTLQAPPAASTLSGTVVLGNYTADKTIVPVTVSVGTTNYPVNLDANGNFSIPGITPGSYTVKVKASHWLAVSAGTVNLAANANIGTVTLKNGDVNRDNKVNMGDYVVVKQAWNATPTSSNWNANADLNADGRVNMGDYTIIKMNWNQVGQ